MKAAALHLPYFKQGEDLEYALEHSENVPDALLAHAEQLRAASEILTRLADELRGHPVKIAAHDYRIVISGKASLIDDLVEKALLDPWIEYEEVDET